MLVQCETERVAIAAHRVIRQRAAFPRLDVGAAASQNETTEADGMEELLFHGYFAATCTFNRSPISFSYSLAVSFP